MSMYTPSIRPPHDLHIHRGITQARPPPLFLLLRSLQHGVSVPFPPESCPVPTPSQPAYACALSTRPGTTRTGEEGSGGRVGGARLRQLIANDDVRLLHRKFDTGSILWGSNNTNAQWCTETQPLRGAVGAW